MSRLDRAINILQPKLPSPFVAIFSLVVAFYSWSLFMISVMFGLVSIFTGYNILMKMENMIYNFFQFFFSFFVGRPSPDEKYSLHYVLDPRFELLPQGSFNRNLPHMSIVLSKLAYEDKKTITHVLNQFKMFSDTHFIESDLKHHWSSFVWRMAHLKDDTNFFANSFITHCNDGTEDVTFVVFGCPSACNLVEWSNRSHPVPFQSMGRVHPGFLHSLGFYPNEMRNPVKDICHEIDKSQRIVVTGHGLGGALAAIFGVHLMKKYEGKNTIIDIVTFGQPRVGDEGFVQTTEALINDPSNKFKYYRFVNENDLIPRTLVFSGDYKHTRTGFIWFQNNEVSLNDRSKGDVHEYPPVTFFSGGIKAFTSLIHGESFFRYLLRLPMMFTMNFLSDHLPGDYERALKCATKQGQLSSCHH